MYVSAAGQIEYPPGFDFNAERARAESEDRPAKRQKTNSGWKNKTMPERPDAHEKAPEALKSVYKRWQKMQKYDMHGSLDLIDPQLDPNGLSFQGNMLKEVKGEEGVFSGDHIQTPFPGFLGEEEGGNMDLPGVFEVKRFPGLFVYPNLLPPNVQKQMLDKLLHRDLSKPEHQTNVHLHYNVPYPSAQPHTPENHKHGSFFDPTAQTLQYTPKASHQLIDTQKMLDKKLRWITLGGQYDWTNKVYPSGPPPPFPPDIKELLEALFPMKAEAAIVNLYSPGDTLSAHRDVSEACAQPLVSISLGCDAIFLVGIEDEPVLPAVDPADPHAQIKSDLHAQQAANKSTFKTAVMKLRSGDALLMSGRSRYAWHGVPKVLPDTCPEYLHDWPALGEGAEKYKDHKGWMKSKRVNLNVRQMFASAEAAGDAVEGVESAKNATSGGAGPSCAGN